MIDQIDVIVAIHFLDPFECPFAAAFPILRRVLEYDGLAPGDELLHEGPAVEIADPRKGHRPALAVLADALQHTGVHAWTPPRKQPIHPLAAQEMIHDEQCAVTAPVRRHETVGSELQAPCNAILYRCNRRKRHGIASRSLGSGLWKRGSVSFWPRAIASTGLANVVSGV